MSALAQIQASDPNASVFVTANAGSGKTKTLVSRVARLLRRGVDPAAILCVTYTKAAAAEMQTRLFDELGKWSILKDDALAAEIAKLEGVGAHEFGPDDLSRARALFARALETPGGLKIDTIHAFCEKLLRRFPLEAGVSPRFQVLEDSAADALSREARETVALAATQRPEGDPLARAYAHFAVELAHMQFDEMMRTLEAKRTELANYVAACDAGEKRTPTEICGTDGTAPETLEVDLAATIDWGRWRAIEAALAASSSADQALAGRMEEAREADGSFDSLRRVFLKEKSAEPRANLVTKKIDGAIRDWLNDVQDRVIAAREPILAARVARDSTHLLTLARAYASVYETIKASNRALDFTDLITRARDLLQTREDAAWVLFKLDGGIDHILLDEAQDTAPEQWDIIRRLTDEFFAGASAARDPRALKRTVFVVGDEKQSIYSFQGAQPERLNRETDDYSKRAQEAGARLEVVPLTASWRSTPQVLAFVDAVCAPDDVARALDTAYEAPPKHEPLRDDAGGVDIWPEFKDDPPPDRDAWEPVDAAVGEGARKRLAQRIAVEIKAAVARGDGVQDKDARAPRAVNFGDFLILVRRRDALFEEIIRALKQAGVPVAGADRLKLSEHIVFDDLRAVARFALYPRDDLTFAALLRSPFCDVDEQSLFDLAHDRKGSLFSALRQRADERAEWRAAYALFDEVLSASRSRAPFEFYGRLLGRLDDQGRSMRARLLDRLGREAEDAIDEFLNQALAAEARGVHDLEGFAAGLDASDVVVKRELEEKRGEVRVMTVHGAKGLEAPIVFLPDTTVRAKPMGSTLFETEDGGFLWAPRKDDDCAAAVAARARRDLKNDQESLRLLYVAMTRARDRLIVCGRVPATRGPEPGSWWMHLKAAFARDGIREQVRPVMLGDMEIERYGPDPVTAPARSDEGEHAAAMPAWTRQRLTAERGARWASPSNIADQAKAPAPSPLAERSGLGRFRRGDLIHKLFEVLPDVAPDKRRAAAERLLGREPGLTPEQRSEMIAAAFGVLEDPRFAEVFGPGSRAEAALAGTAPDLPQGIAISGRLDRLVVGPDRVLVVDYKTNRPAPDRIEDADPAYTAQMAVYVAVLRALYPERAVEAALIWTDGPRLMPVPQDVIERALESLRRDS
ncbi:MAG TPA: double-strand break repair helicase AddA [Caulobacteraceae bacterium]|jgi:ATP-dependent helicase/nuclease subunit A